MADVTFIGFTLMQWIFIFIYVLMAPWFAIGVFKFVTWIDALFKVRSGHIKVFKILPNDQLVKFWVRPIGGKITFKAKNPLGISDKSTMTVQLSKGWVWREGGIPFIKLDKNNNQVSWEQNVVSDTPKEVVDELSDTAYAAGMMVGFKAGKDIRKLILMLTLVIIIVIAGIFLNYILVSNIHVTTQTVQVVATNATEHVV